MLKSEELPAPLGHNTVWSETLKMVSPLKVTIQVVTSSGQESAVKVMVCAWRDAKRANANVAKAPRRMEVLRFMIKVFSNCRTNIDETGANPEDFQPQNRAVRKTRFTVRSIEG